MTIIRTGDLLLRPIRDDDAPRFAELCNDIDIARNTARIGHPYRLEDARAFVKYASEAIAAGTEYPLAVCDDDEIIACAGVSKKGDSVYELGYWVGAPYRRRGVATAAGLAAVQFAFLTLGAKQAISGYFRDNPASGRVLKRIGFVPTGESVTMASVARGRDVETVRLSLPRDAFQMRRDIVIEELAN
ncbi:MAG: GNAT family N-acetyltransferase [Pseudomonadota bacterium]